VNHEPKNPVSKADSTTELLARARVGDADAVGALAKRYMPFVRRWAHGRLPRRAGGIADTDDLVQCTIVRALGRIQHFEVRREGAFAAYLRQILLNQIRDEIRRSHHHPPVVDMGDDIADPQPTPLEAAVGRDALERYEAAFARLSETHQAAVNLRLELGLSHAEVGHVLGGRSANAARLLVARAVTRLAEEMEADA
jgi:RNA polymerase sigma-70 factor, ECF subfamily